MEGVRTLKHFVKMVIIGLQNCVESLGVPEVLVNIAGVRGEEKWEDMYDINVVSLNIKIIFSQVTSIPPSLTKFRCINSKVTISGHQHSTTSFQNILHHCIIS